MECPEEPGVCSGNPPTIVAHGPDAGWLTGTPVHASQVVQALEECGSAATVARQLGLSEHQVRVAIEYHERQGA